MSSYAKHKPFVLKKLFPENHYVQHEPENRLLGSAQVALHVDHGDLFIGEGDYRTGALVMQLNTALVMGSDIIKLAARLHAQCKIHSYVNGPNRKWLADIIRQGLDAKFYRPDMGWESVIALLEESDESPIVTSYSVCDGFPSMEVAEYAPDLNISPDADEYDLEEAVIGAWEALSDAERWDLAAEKLISNSAKTGLELTPDNWDDYCFSDGVTAFDLRESLFYKE